MSQRYLDSIRNPQPYPASDTERSNPPSRSQTPVGPKAYSTPSYPPSRSRTPASVLELINPKPYPSAQHAYDNPVVRPTAVKGSPEKAYQPREDDKPRSKKLTKTRSTPRTPAGSDGETKSVSQPPPTNGYKGGSVSSLDLALQIADREPIKRETTFDVEAGPKPAPRTTSVDASRPPKYDNDRDYKVASTALGSKPVDTTRSSHPTSMTNIDRKEKMAKAGLVFFLVVIFFALGLGLGLRGSGSGYTSGAFANTAGSECRFTCRNRAQYTKRASNPLIVFAIDGLPNDVLTNQDTAKNIKRMSECGVRSQDMIQSFASTTYPNLWTFLTGRYPENHGVISDYIRSTTRSSRIFEPRTSQEYLDEDEWYTAKPLWQTAREQGVLSASHSWVGNNMQAYDNDVRQTINSKPNYYQRYNSLLTPQDKIDTVLKWIQQDNVDNIPQFISVFFNEPGDSIRQYGHNSQQAKAALLEIDLAIGDLLDYLYSRQDGACFNMVIVSPSALVNTTCSNDNGNVKFLEQQVPNTRGLETTTPGYLNSFARIRVNSLDADDARDTNEKLAAYLKCRFTAEGSVYTRDDLPTRYHYSSSIVPDDVYVLMKDGKSFAMSPTNYDQQFCQYSSDGYDPNDVESKATFVGFGMNFKENYRASEFETIDVYNLMTMLLGVTGEPNNGTAGVLNTMLKSTETFPNTPMDFASESTCSFANRDLSGYDTGCICNPVNEGDPTAMERGQAVLSTTSASAARHIPFGAPRLLASANPDSGSSCKLYQTSYVMAYDKTLSISKYASLTLTPGFNTVTMPFNCIITDTRLAVGENPSCDTFGIVGSLSLAPDIQQSFLLQPELSVGSADAGIITSNIIPIYSRFETDIWDQLTATYRTWANLATSTSINIVQGPIYDLDHDGVADPLSLIASSNAWAGQTVVPSHFFIIATRCANNTALDSCQPSQVQMMAFILPHNNMGLPCQQISLADHLMEYRASIMDVERMTGLCFFPDWTISDDVNIRRTITVMKTDVPEMMWTN